MKYRKFFAALGATLILFVGLARCVGTFTLTLKVHGFVRGIANPWISWLVFLVCVIIPVYGLAILVDAIVLNSIEFWSGGNPAAFQNGETEYSREIAAGDERAVFHYLNGGRTLEIELFKSGEHRKTLHMDRERPGQLFARQTDGSLARLEVDLARGPGYENAVIWEGREVAAVRRLSAADEDRVRRFVPEHDAGQRALAAKPARGTNSPERIKL